MHLDYRRDLDEELAKRAPSRHSAPLPLTLAPGHELMWLGRTRWHLPWLGLAVSASLHAGFIFGLNPRPEPPAKLEMPPVVEITFPEMPKEEEEEEPIPVENDGEPVETLESVAVPSLADIPTTVPIDAFVQQVNISDMMPKRPDVPNVVSIPANYRKGGPVQAKNLGEIFSLADLDRRPEPRVQVPPTYPYGQKSKQLPPVTVTVNFIVDKEGNVVNPTVVRATHDGFEDAAINGVLKWKFRPGMRRGKVVNTRIEVPLIFRITDD